MNMKNIKWWILVAFGIVSIVVKIYIKNRIDLTQTPIVTDKRKHSSLVVSQVNSDDKKDQAYISDPLDKKRELSELKKEEMTFDEVDDEISILSERISNEKIVERLNSSNDPEFVSKAQALFSKLTELRRIKLEKSIAALAQRVSDLETESVR